MSAQSWVSVNGFRLGLDEVGWCDQHISLLLGFCNKKHIVHVCREKGAFKKCTFECITIMITVDFVFVGILYLQIQFNHFLQMEVTVK